MHDNARARGDREYHCDLSLPLVDDLSDRGGQQRRPDDNVGCSATKATFVVNPELEVRGVRGLRVADASVMPTITRGHTHAPSVLIGAKAADLIAAANRR